MWESSSVTTLANPPAGSPATPGWPGYNLHTKPYFTLAIKPQFLFLSAFSGMLMQGYHNRKLITQFFHSNSCEIVPCYLLGYGVPIIIMVYSLTCSVLCNWDCGGTEPLTTVIVKKTNNFIFSGFPSQLHPRTQWTSLRNRRTDQDLWRILARETESHTLWKIGSIASHLLDCLFQSEESNVVWTSWNGE